MSVDSVQVTQVVDSDSSTFNVFDGAKSGTLGKVPQSCVPEAIFGTSSQWDDHSLETPMQQIPDEATKTQH